MVVAIPGAAAQHVFTVWDVLTEVRAIGHRVVVRQLAQPLLHPARLGDVLDLGDEVRRGAVVVAHE